MNLEKIFIIVLTAIFINNIVFSRIIGLPAFFEETKKIKSALTVGISTAVIITFSSSVAWIFNKFVLSPLDITQFFLLTYVMIIMLFGYLIKILLNKLKLGEYAAGEDMGLIANSAVLGIILINMQEKFSFTENLVSSMASGVGYLLAVLIIAGINERLEETDTPKAFKGIPISMISMGIVAMIFMGFFGLKG